MVRSDRHRELCPNGRNRFKWHYKYRQGMDFEQPLATISFVVHTQLLKLRQLPQIFALTLQNNMFGRINEYVPGMECNPFV